MTPTLVEWLKKAGRPPSQTRPVLPKSEGVQNSRSSSSTAPLPQQGEGRERVHVSGAREGTQRRGPLVPEGGMQ